MEVISLVSNLYSHIPTRPKHPNYSHPGARAGTTSKGGGSKGASGGSKGAGRERGSREGAREQGGSGGSEGASGGSEGARGRLLEVIRSICCPPLVTPPAGCFRGDGGGAT